MIEIITPGDLDAFDPGSEIEVFLNWKFDAAPERIELRLVWSTSGKGDQDLKVVNTIAINNPRESEERSVMITLPWGPYSFSGKLISLSWGLEAVAFPSKFSTRKSITVAPRGEEVVLTPVDAK